MKRDLATVFPLGALGVAKLHDQVQDSDARMWESQGTRGAHTPHRVQITASMAPGSQQRVETSEREKLMGMFCPGKEENKKPTTENRAGKHYPLKGGSVGTLAACSWAGCTAG